MNDRSTNSNHQPDDADLQAPDALVEALRRLEEPNQVRVSSERDAEILARCRAELAAARSRSERRIIAFPMRWWRGIAAAAAVLVLGFVIIRSSLDRSSIAINTDQPTILDALALARKVEAGGEPGGAFDLNGDGLVNAADANWLAQKAVILPEGGAL